MDNRPASLGQRGNPFKPEVQAAAIAASFSKSILPITHISHPHQNYGRTESQPLEDAYAIGVQLRDTYWDLRHGARHVARMIAPAGHVSGTDLTLEPTTVMHEPFEVVLLHVPCALLEAFTVEHDLPRLRRLNLKEDFSEFDPVMLHLAQAMLPAIDRPDEVSQLFADHLSRAMIAHIIGRYGGVTGSAVITKGGLSAWQLRLSQEMIEARLDGDLTLSELAGICKLSVSHFSKGFAKSTGMPPHRWMMRRRLDKARELMRDTQLPLCEIALACGFADQAHMTRVFSGRFGVSPALWRKHAG